MSGTEITPKDAARELLERIGARSDFGPFCERIGIITEIFASF